MNNLSSLFPYGEKFFVDSVCAPCVTRSAIHT